MKVLFVATVVKNHIMEFHIPYLKMFKDMGWETAVAARNDYVEPTECNIPYCDRYYDIPFDRSPFKPGNIKAYRELRDLVEFENYDIIHCHTPVGGVLARLAARKARKRGGVVIYTAHGFHFYKGAPLINWLLYYPVEKKLSRLTDVLITINKEDYNRASNFRAGMIEYVPGIGVDLRKFNGKKDTERDLRTELNIPEDATILLSVGEINKNKNHRIVVEVLPHIDNVWYVICGDGSVMKELKALSVRLGVDDRVLLPGYRNDLPIYYGLADFFVFPSYREGLPVALMEAMASGLVCIASRNRGTDDLLGESELKFDPDSREELEMCIKAAMSNDYSDEVRKNLDRLENYEIGNVLSIMRGIYKKALAIKGGALEPVNRKR